MPYLSFICDTSCPVIRQLRESVFEEMPRCPHADLTKTTLNLKEEKAARKPPKITFRRLDRESQSKQSSIVLVQPVCSESEGSCPRGEDHRISGSEEQRNDRRPACNLGRRC